jgi:hypothetical protein
MKVGPSGNFYAGTNNASLGVQERGPDGSFLRNLGGAAYQSIAILPGNVLWAGNAALAEIDVFDLVTGLQTRTIPLDHGQTGSLSMTYDRSTDSVLMTDVGSVFERDAAGGFIRQFPGPPHVMGEVDFTYSAGVTRGPDGDVFATDFNQHRIARWQSDGTFLDYTNVFAGQAFPVNIIWAGNVPEPSAGVLLGICMVAATATWRDRALNRRTARFGR